MFCIHLKKKKLKIKLFYMIFNELLVSQTGTPDLWGSVHFYRNNKFENRCNRQLQIFYNRYQYTFINVIQLASFYTLTII